MLGRVLMSKKLLWVVALGAPALFLVILPALKAGMILLGHALSPAGPDAVAFAVSPGHGEVVGTLTPTLRWPPTGAEMYQVEVVEDAGKDNVPVCSFQSALSSVRVPDGILEPERVYLWSVSAQGQEAGPVYTGRFSTATRVCSGRLCASPAAFPLSQDTLVGGATLAVTVPAGQPVVVELPESLTAAGRDRIAVSGSFSVLVRPSTRFGLSPNQWRPVDGDEIRVRGGNDAVRIPLSVDASSLGAHVRTVASGFDPVADTPAFTNFASGMLANLTRGTCLGMVLAARRHFSQCRECMNKDTCACFRMRLQSLLDSESLRKEMNYLHLANLDPQNWSSALVSVVGSGSRRNVVGGVLAELRAGRPVPLALVAPGTGAAAAGKNIGHAVLAYVVHEFEDSFVLQVYDPDDEYVAGGALSSFLVARRTSGDTAQFLYGSASGWQAVDVFPLPDNALLEALAPYVSSPYSSLDSRLAAPEDR